MSSFLICFKKKKIPRQTSWKSGTNQKKSYTFHILQKGSKNISSTSKGKQYSLFAQCNHRTGKSPYNLYIWRGFFQHKTGRKMLQKSAEKTIKSQENQRTVYSDKDRNTQNYKKSRGATFDSATPLWIIPLFLYFTLQCHLVVHTSYCTLFITVTNSRQCESRISIQCQKFKIVFNLFHS